MDKKEKLKLIEAKTVLRFTFTGHPAVVEEYTPIFTKFMRHRIVIYGNNGKEDTAIYEGKVRADDGRIIRVNSQNYFVTEEETGQLLFGFYNHP